MKTKSKQSHTYFEWTCVKIIIAFFYFSLFGILKVALRSNEFCHGNQIHYTVMVEANIKSKISPNTNQKFQRSISTIKRIKKIFRKPHYSSPLKGKKSNSFSITRFFKKKKENVAHHEYSINIYDNVDSTIDISNKEDNIEDEDETEGESEDNIDELIKKYSDSVPSTFLENMEGRSLNDEDSVSNKLQDKNKTTDGVFDNHIILLDDWMARQMLDEIKHNIDY